MDAQGLEVSFESRIPVVRQILILEALDFVYSVFALAETEWNETLANSPDWPRLISTHPGKLLRPEHVLTVEYARTGSIIEVVSGVAGPVVKALKFLASYRLQVEKARITNPREKLKTVHQQLLPLIDMLKKRGASQDQVNQLVAKAYMYVDDVLTSLLIAQKLELAPLTMVKRLSIPCPTCKGAGRLLETCPP